MRSAFGLSSLNHMVESLGPVVRFCRLHSGKQTAFGLNLWNRRTEERKVFSIIIEIVFIS